MVLWGGHPNAGGQDIFLIKFDKNGEMLWLNQFGTVNYDRGHTVAVDKDGNSYIGGSAGGGSYVGTGLDGNEYFGWTDAFISKFDKDGKKLWTKQLGTEKNDSINDIIIDKDGTLLLTGNMGEDAFAARFDRDGEKIWKTVWRGDGFTKGTAVAVSKSGDIFITGNVNGSIDEKEGVTQSCHCFYKNVCSECRTFFFLVKVGADGTMLWTNQWGVGNSIEVPNIFIDAEENIFIGGITRRSFPGFTHSKGDCGYFIWGYNIYATACYDQFFFKTDRDGNFLQVVQWGESGNDFSGGILVDGEGHLVAGGRELTFWDENGDNLRKRKVELKKSGDIAPFSDDQFVLTGGVESELETIDIFLGLIDKKGNDIWSQTISGNRAADEGFAVALSDDGGVVVAGITNGSMGGRNWNGKKDVFISKWLSDGQNVWNNQIGTDEDDIATDVAVDPEGNIFVTGYTEGRFPGNNRHGKKDILLAKFDRNGTHLWTKQWGGDWEWNNKGKGVAADNEGNVYVTGKRYYANIGETVFVSKFNTDGGMIWDVKLENRFAFYVYGITVDINGDVIITGETKGAFDGHENGGRGCYQKVYGGPGSGPPGGFNDRYAPVYCNDGYVAKFSKDGEKIWLRQWGRENNEAGRSVITDEKGNIFVTGSANDYTNDGVLQGKRDLFLGKWSGDGENLWYSEINIGTYINGLGITLGSKDEVIITGYTYKALKEDEVKTYSPFLFSVERTGIKSSLFVWGSNSNDRVTSVVSGKDGKIFVTGFTDGIIGNNKSYGGRDVFLTIFEEIPR